ncbi:MAG: hypothetical protein GY927_17170 [bacterium]|nr:hypothetical protein [bacterium]
MVFLGFGKGHALLAEKRFRHALGLAIGRGGMTQIGSGEVVVPTLSPLPRTARGTVLSSGLLADTPRAKSLLSKLAHTYSEIEDSSLKLEIIVNKSRPDDRSVAARVAAALFRIGIQTRVIELHAHAFARRVDSGQCDLYVGQWATLGTFGETTLRTAFAIGGLSAPNTHFEREFSTQWPIVPLFHRGLRVHHRSDLRSVDFDHHDRLRYEDVWVGP